jgi:hypothetical protein
LLRTHIRSSSRKAFMHMGQSKANRKKVPQRRELHPILNWGTARYVLMTCSFLAGLAGVCFEPDQLTTSYLYVLLAATISPPFFIFFFGILIPWGKKITHPTVKWKKPEWDSSPLNQSEPFPFFHFFGCVATAWATGLMIGALVWNFKVFPAGLTILIQTISLWIGLRIAIKRTCSEIS